MIKIYSNGTKVYMYNTILKKYSTYSSYGLQDHIKNMITGNQHYGWHNQSYDLEFDGVPLIAETENLETFFDDYPELLL